MPRLAFVDPSTGSTTTVTSRSACSAPDSSLSTAQAGVVEDRQAGLVGGQVAAVLARSGPGETPVVEVVQGPAHGCGRVPEDGEEVVVVHRGRPYRPVGLMPRGCRRRRGRLAPMAAIDVAGFVADLKDHAVDHGFHVHDERHFVETYSLRQAWEVDLHPEEACGGPLDLHLALEVDPRVLLGVRGRRARHATRTTTRRTSFHFPLIFTWALPPLPNGPDLLVLATDLAGLGGPDLPLEVSAIDSFASVTDAPERRLTIVARVEVSLARVFLGQEQLCDVARPLPGGEPLPARAGPGLAGRDLSQTPATVALDAAGVAYRTTEYEGPDEGGYGDALVQALGLDPDTVGKTLVAVLDDGRHVLAVVPVSATLDLKALARLAGARRAAMAEPRHAERLTGSVVGGISPLGSRRPLPVFVDELLTVDDEVHVSGGRRGLELSLAPADLVRATDAVVGPIAT